MTEYRATPAAIFSNRERTRLNRGTDLATVRRPDPDERCAHCGVLENRSTPLVLDHDHATGAFRNWLCSPCNTREG